MDRTIAIILREGCGKSVETIRVAAIDAIGRLNSQRTGRPSCDAWIDYAVGQWRAFLNETKST